MCWVEIILVVFRQDVFTKQFMHAYFCLLKVFFKGQVAIEMMSGRNVRKDQEQAALTAWLCG